MKNRIGYILSRRIFPALFLGMVCVGLDGQDPVFSHFYANSLLLNPGMAGVEGNPRFFMNYRNQWPQTGSTFITYHASYDQYVEKLHGGIGIRLMNDQQANGLFNAFNLDGIYAYHLKAGRYLRLTGAVQASFGFRSFNPGNLILGDMIDPVTGQASALTESVAGYDRPYPDFATGITAFYHQFFGGVAVHHLLAPVITDQSDPNGQLARRYTLHAGMIIPVIKRGMGKELFQLSPNMVFIQQKNIQQLSYGIEMIYNDLTLGLWARHDLQLNYGNLLFTTGYDARRWRVRYTYDLRLSNPAVRLPNMGAHEISLLIIYDNLNNDRRGRAIKYPKI